MEQTATATVSATTTTVKRTHYVAYRVNKRAEDEKGFLKHNADMMRAWRKENADHLAQWRKNNINYMLRATQGRARAKGIPWNDDMTQEVCSNLMHSECFYCKLSDDSRVHGIDRMNNNKGYERSNCVGCCKNCNFMKKALDAKTYIERCIHIASHRGQGDTFFENAWQSSNRTSYNGYKKRALAKDLTFELDETMFLDICSRPCHYCCRASTKVNKNGIDRIDNTQGYNVHNCAPCCSECNAMKTNMLCEDFVNTCIRVSQNAGNINVPEMPRCYRVITKRVMT
jgi:hypothetical protein